MIIQPISQYNLAICNIDYIYVYDISILYLYDISIN